MARRIMLRAGKTPYHPYSHEETLRRNLLGTNSGNLVFSEAAWRLLSTRDTRVTSAGLGASAKKAAEINADFDHLVLPFANAFRVSFRKSLDRYSEMIEKLRVPVTVLGVGAQTDLDYSGGNLDPIRKATTRFVRAVLERSPAIGVRGEFTYAFLRKLGFSDDQVTVIGCPSVYYYGPDLPALRHPETLDRNSRISMNVSPYVPGIGAMFEANMRHYPDLIYVPQNNESLDQLLWAGANIDPKAKVFPRAIDHPVFTEDRIRLFIDPQSWFKALRARDFSFGTRIHGNIAALLAGTPAFVLAHDSRTLELARYFEIPHMQYSEIGARRLAEEFYATADYRGYHANHAARFDTFTRFLERCGLRHVYMEGEDRGQAFDDRMAKADFPEVLPPLQHQGPVHMAQRLNWLRQRAEIENAELRAQIRKMTP